jgi:lysozyme
MLTPAQLREYRKRAYALLLDKIDKSTPMLIDYEIDSVLRTLFNLSERPDGQEPYVGWMTPFTSSTMTHRTISQTGINLIKEFEGFRSSAYLCPGNVWTIGYGHTATAKSGMTITHKHAQILLKQDLEKFEAAVNRAVKVPLNQNQFDALVSFVFNIGSFAFDKSTLLELLNQEQYELAALQLNRWIYAGKKKLPGLVRRRRAEYRLFTSS